MARAENNFRLKLSKEQKFNYYLPTCIMEVILLVALNYTIEYFYGDYEMWRFILANILFFIFAITIFIFQYKGLYLQKVDIQFSEDQFQEAIQRTVKELEWDIEINQEHFLQAYSIDWFSNALRGIVWGEMITIVKQDSILYFNSICDTNRRMSFFFLAQNKENKKVFLKNLSDAVNNVAEQKTVKDEWSLKRTLLRLIIYPFLIFMIIASIMAIIHPVSPKSVPYGFFGLILAATYFYVDFKLINKNQDNDKQD